MFKSFDNLNAWLQNHADTNKTDALDRLIQSQTGMRSLLQGIPSAYARNYALVQRIKYDSNGNPEDVTPHEQLSIPDNVIANAVASLQQSNDSIQLIPDVFGETVTTDAASVKDISISFADDEVIAVEANVDDPAILMHKTTLPGILFKGTGKTISCSWGGKLKLKDGSWFYYRRLNDWMDQENGSWVCAAQDGQGYMIKMATNSREPVRVSQIKANPVSGFTDINRSLALYVNSLLTGTKTYEYYLRNVTETSISITLEQAIKGLTGQTISFNVSSFNLDTPQLWELLVSSVNELPDAINLLKDL